MAKGLGAASIGAMLAAQQCAICFQPGMHGTTFGGSPLTQSRAGRIGHCEGQNVRNAPDGCIEDKLT